MARRQRHKFIERRRTSRASRIERPGRKKAGVDRNFQIENHVADSDAATRLSTLRSKNPEREILNGKVTAVFVGCLDPTPTCRIVRLVQALHCAKTCLAQRQPCRIHCVYRVGKPRSKQAEILTVRFSPFIPRSCEWPCPPFCRISGKPRGNERAYRIHRRMRFFGATWGYKRVRANPNNGNGAFGRKNLSPLPVNNFCV